MVFFISPARLLPVKYEKHPLLRLFLDFEICFFLLLLEKI